MQEQKRVNRVWAIGTEVRRTDVQLLAVVAVGILLILSPLLLVQSSEGALRSAPVPASGTASPLTPAAGTNYPTYLYNLVRTDNVGSQGTVNQYNAHELRSLWNYSAGGAIWSQPIVANGVAYFGAGDGYEYAIGVLNGSLLWKTYVGLDNDTQTCGGAAGPGVTSTATFSSGRIYVSGGDSVFYALNATTGRVYWQLPIGGTIAQGFYLWASPLIYNHSAYVGIASQCGKPQVPAGLERISLVTHSEIAYFNSSVPDPNGSSIWGSPSINTATNTIFVSTGNPYAAASQYSESMVELNASTLAVIRSWQVPAAQAIPDGDFGVTPSLFQLPNGLAVVAGENKNGYLYEWYQSNLTPVWEDKIGTEINDHFSATEAYGTLYAIGHGATINGVNYSSAIYAINPSTGAYLWEVGTNQSPTAGYAAPMLLDHVVVAPIGATLFVLDARTGAILDTITPGGTLVPPSSYSGGELFYASGNIVHALDIPMKLTATQSAGTGLSPLTDQFTSNVSGGVPAYAYNWSFGDGSYSNLADPSHVYSNPGNYTVKVTVWGMVGAPLSHRFSVAVT
jgi:outer membrane protein assembly factor BamB